MGCIFKKKVKERKVTAPDTLLIKSSNKQNKFEKTNQMNNKLVSIDQSTFIGEKKYGDFLKEYEILEFIGKGAFGTVQKVKHKLTHQIRAMKIIKKLSLKNPNQEKLLLREIDVLKQINHPNIIKLFEFFYDDKKYYIITEFCDGGELFDKITEVGSFNERKAALILKNILQAVAYCHSLNIVHRDLKPENILLEFNSDNDKENFSIKIIDFGTSRKFVSNNKLTEKTGTPYYIAPEVLKKRYDEKCDIWSCGVIMYIILSGEPPFNGPNDHEIIKNVSIGVYDLDIEAFKFISEDAKFLLRNLLQYDPTHRFSAVQALDSKWIKELAPNSLANHAVAHNILSHLRTFRADQKLLEATLSLIVNQLISKEETFELKKVFMELDTNNDGKLSYEEICEGYKKIYGSLQPEKEAQIIFDTVDADKNGYISYEEFIRATIDRAKLVNENKLEYAFKLFDKNGDGFISATEIKEVLGKDVISGEEIWKAIIREVDLNGDGEISLSEFKQMMDKIISNNNTSSQTITFNLTRRIASSNAIEMIDLSYRAKLDNKQAHNLPMENLN